MFLSKPKINDNDREKFRGVRIIIIDEVSFLKKSELKKLMSNLQDLGDTHSPFGGYNVVFGGDFQQLNLMHHSLNYCGTQALVANLKVCSIVQSY